ncbi:MAG TPA: dihydrodipicolinate synthase family protein [Gemmatimonadaceae bacterium]|nr:dihydrodipicolinate synthase family protein [Gemmatimonadaceae bacterium]
MAASEPLTARARLSEGAVIPAHPLALDSRRKLDERRQTALTRYYLDAGAGGLAVGVHTTQFAIRDAGLYRPVLELAMHAVSAAGGPRPVMVAGIVGRTPQALTEAEVAVALGYDAGLLSLGAWREETEEEILDHCERIAAVLPLFGFYLQPAVGGRMLSYRFWRAFAEIPNVWAIKVAPFNRYQTLDVVRAVVEAGRSDIALYTGNDDNIIADLMTPFPVAVGGQTVIRWFDGGLLGQWAVWTRAAVQILQRVKSLRDDPAQAPDLLRLGAALTDANAAIFDPAHAFAGCIPGIHEVLRRQGLLEGTWTLDESELLSPGQADEITRVLRTHVELNDDDFVAANIDRWLSG